MQLLNYQSVPLPPNPPLTRISHTPCKKQTGCKRDGEADVWGAHATRVQFLATRQKLLKHNAEHHALGKMEGFALCFGSFRRVAKNCTRGRARSPSGFAGLFP